VTRKRKTIEKLAKKAHLDIDKVLIELWDCGYKEVLDPKDRLRDINRARRALGLATRRELKSVSYWMSILDLYEAEFRSLLQKLSVPISKTVQTLPRKAISRLKSEARKHGIDPITGKAVSSNIRSEASGASDFKWQTIGHDQELRRLIEDE